ncbi:histone deacetylase family protein [Flavobacterium aurantiibacter]|uniref:Histone deacetylase n=1 Tax=Flavobacterium aurantiibacter TaxID=2023067 RepID=A0A255ZZS6_9FLAO|nr:histone deacetylase [Flavobacterium aurantiibacter]OYQ46889.1 histone deacetylase [Flavobacterium aurantiibacter]
MIKIAFDPIYAHPLPENHRFPMLKYKLIPQQLLHEGTCTAAHFFSPQPCLEEVVLWTHEKAYYDKLIHQELSTSEQRKIGFPQSPELTLRELIITQGTVDAAVHAIAHGAALNVAGGTHHAFAERGEGFCLLNDMAIAANYLLHKDLRKKIIVIDLDVHQGNGTAKLMENNAQVFTFSMHGATNYPFHKEKSDLDVGLANGTTGATYLSILNEILPKLLDDVQPDFAFYLAGVDILETDKFGKLQVSMEDCKTRDLIVFQELKKKNIPVTVALGGGYSPEVKTIVEAHCNTFRLAVDLFD